jgi:hypothetical protein
LGVQAKFRRKKLESDMTLEARVHRLVNDTHAAIADFLEDFVMRDSLVDHLSRATVARAMQPRDGELV